MDRVVMNDYKLELIEPSESLLAHRLETLRELVKLYDLTMGYGYADQADRVLKIVETFGQGYHLIRAGREE